MSPKVPSEQRRIPTSIAFPGTLLDRIDAIAAAQHRSRSWIIEQAVEQYLAHGNPHRIAQHIVDATKEPWTVDHVVHSGPGAIGTSSWPDPASTEDAAGRIAPDAIVGYRRNDDGSEAPILASEDDPLPGPPCPHEHTRRDKAASGGFRKVCLDCGEVVLR